MILAQGDEDKYNVLVDFEQILGILTVFKHTNRWSQGRAGSLIVRCLIISLK